LSDQIGIRPTLNDNAVKSDIEAALTRYARADAKKIIVECHGSDVTLSGTVHNGSERETATHSAWSTPGVRKVVDRMSVAYRPCGRSVRRKVEHHA
jgi:osmotically-inducible protein OsmY